MLISITCILKNRSPQSVIDLISAKCSDIKQVFSSSYLLLSYTSKSEMKHFLKSPKPMPHHFFAEIKDNYEAYSIE